MKSHAPPQKKSRSDCFAPGATSSFACAPIVLLNDASFQQTTRLLRVTSTILQSNIKHQKTFKKTTELSKQWGAPRVKRAANPIFLNFHFHTTLYPSFVLAKPCMSSVSKLLRNNVDLGEPFRRELEIGFSERSWRLPEECIFSTWDRHGVRMIGQNRIRFLVTKPNISARIQGPCWVVETSRMQEYDDIL